MTEREKNTVAIAERVMGWKVKADRTGSGVTMFSRPDACNIATWDSALGGDGRSWNPYASIADAFEIVEKFEYDDAMAEPLPRFAFVALGRLATRWVCRLRDLTTDRTIDAEAPTACDAICAAALATVESSSNSTERHR